ncbi:MAG: hypothetical protein M3373_13730 [Gemmatimonadota bacterium]|nr:hypothetical protein [Gemmatimonadota bacterium]
MSIESAIEPVGVRPADESTRRVRVPADRCSESAWRTLDREVWMPIEEEAAPFGGDLLTLLRGAIRSEELAANLLLSLQAHISALALVAEAERRGAVGLPPGVSHAVALARGQVPFFLTGCGGT